MAFKQVVISVHGILTRAVWQKDLATPLSMHEMIPVSHDYGKFSLLRFANPWSRRRRIEAFHKYYADVVDKAGYGIDLEDPRRRPSVIAHSLGSYIVGQCLMKYEDVRLNKLIICGSILRRDFDWSTLFARDQVAEVRNDCGLRDAWVRRAHWLVRDAGASGAEGFEYFGTLLTEEFGELLEHSDHFARTQVEHRWIPFLQRPPSELRVVHSRDVMSHAELSARLDAANAIDKLAFAGLEGYRETELPRGLSLEWLEINPDLYTFLIDRASGQLVGYLNAMPLSRDVAEKIVAGKIVDNQITAGDVVPFERGSEPRPLYLMSINVHPDMRASPRGLYSEPPERLVNAFLSKLVYYALQRDFAVSEIIAVGWTPQGQQLCRLFGMNQQHGVTDPYGNPIYRASIQELAQRKRKIHPGLTRLVALYGRKGLI